MSHVKPNRHLFLSAGRALKKLFIGFERFDIKIRQQYYGNMEVWDAVLLLQKQDVLLCMDTQKIQSALYWDRRREEYRSPPADQGKKGKNENSAVGYR